MVMLTAIIWNHDSTNTHCSIMAMATVISWHKLQNMAMICRSMVMLIMSVGMDLTWANVQHMTRTWVATKMTLENIQVMAATNCLGLMEHMIHYALGVFTEQTPSWTMMVCYLAAPHIVSARPAHCTDQISQTRLIAITRHVSLRSPPHPVLPWQPLIT